MHLDGIITTLGDPLPAAVDASSFDFATGLGAMTVTLAPGAAGDYFVEAFFDHEIDEPGFVFGDVLANFQAGTLNSQYGAC